MTHNRQPRNAECGSKTAALSSARLPFFLQHSAFGIRPSRRGLTLIELLVTIVIMVTVLAGALPLLSPNNNSRKIREASRQLTTLLAQAQAQAARDGRPVGVAFRETGTSSPYSGMALEAYMIAEPPAFTGFSEYSRVTVASENATYGVQDSGNPIGTGGTLFAPKLYGKPIFSLQFSLYGQQDPVPPRMIRLGDVLNIEGNYFIIVDDSDPNEEPNAIDPDTGYAIPAFEFHAVWLNNNGQLLSPGGKTYSFRRQPTNTSEQPLQFPRGIGIDMDASGATGIGLPIDFDSGGATTVGVMFSPNGSIETVYRDGVRREGVEQIFLLLGLFENGNNGSQDPNDYDFSTGSSITNDELAQRRTRINWLSGDSRWVTINRAGRIITADNNISFDPRTSPYIDSLSGTALDKAAEQRRRQIFGVYGDGSGTVYSYPDSVNRTDSRIIAPGARQSARNMNATTGR